MKKLKYDAVLFFKFLRIEHLNKDIGFIREAYECNGKTIRISGFENNSKLAKNVTYLCGDFNSTLAKIRTALFVLRLRKKTNKLILLHVSRENIFLSFLFGFLSNNSTYIKSDINIDSFIFNNNSFWKEIKVLDFIIKRLAIRYVSKISAETHLGKELIDAFFNREIKTFYLPNSSILSPIKEKNISKKKDSILYVGRLGCHHKNVELILDSMNKIKTSPLHFDFVGPISDDFLKKINKFKEKNKISVTFHGPIYDNFMLKKLYNEAKYFILSSRSEGFPLVFAEALSSGCIILSSNVHAAKDVVVSDDFIFSSKDQLCSILSQLPSLDSEPLNRESLTKYEKFERKKLIKVLSEEVIN